MAASGPRAGRRKGGTEWVGQVLREHQAQELRMARGYPECRGLAREQVEDLYQDTILALLARPYRSEEHLLNALRKGIRHRALNLHRDERRRRRKFAADAPGIYAAAEASAGDEAPEFAAIVRQDRLIVAEFLTELSPLEQRVFWLAAEGMRYRAIAPALGLEINLARKATRSVEKKRERFQLLYDTGRLCGFRSVTIRALQSGHATTAEMAERAFAHLDSCAHCRTEHQTNAQRLRSRFQGQAAALLPMPAFAQRIGWMARVDARLRTWVERLLPSGAPIGPGGAREGAIALIAGGGISAKVAAGVATVAVLAGSTTASVVLDHSGGAHRPHRVARAQRHRIPAIVPAAPSPVPIPHASPASSDRASSPTPSSRPARTRARTVAAEPRREAGGFSYLGVPSTGKASTPTARAASIASVRGDESSRGTSSARSHGGGEFSP